MATTFPATSQAGTQNSGRHLGVALLVIATAQLMVVLDATIVTVALAHIQKALGFSGSGLEWVVNAYVLTLGGLLLLGGRAGDLFGRRRVFIAGLLLFSVASLAGGLATSQACAAVGGVFFFLTLFVQDVWGYSPLRAGVSFLPFTAVMLVATVAATRLAPRVGPRPLLIAGSVLSAGGLFWLSRLTVHATYAGSLLWPALIIGAGLGLLFLPLSLVSLARVDEADSGAAASLLNVGRQVGASIGLAVLGTVAWTVIAHSARAQAVAAARSATRTSASTWRAAAYQHALTAGFDRAFLVAAAIAVLMLIVAMTVIRNRRADLEGS